MPDSAPPSERRRAERYLVCFPAWVVRADGEERLALIRNLSVTGVLLLVRTRQLAVGDVLTLQLHIEDDAAVFRSASGEVVRIENIENEEGPWLRRTAVQFRDPLTMYEAQIEAFKERAHKFGVRS